LHNTYHTVQLTELQGRILPNWRTL